MALAPAGARASRADPAAPRRTVVGLRLRVLGAPDDGVAVGGRGAAARAPELDRPRRDRRQEDRAGWEAAPDEGAPPRTGRCGALGPGATGGGRMVGRDPASLGLVADHARRTRVRPRGRDLCARAGRLGTVHGPRR